MNLRNVIKLISDGRLDAMLSMLYGNEAVASQRARYLGVVEAFASRYGDDREIEIYSVPGRTELSGNHTDHNYGRVIAASVDLDMIAVVSPRDDGILCLKSEGFSEDVVDPSSFRTPAADRFGTSAALMAGVCVGFLDRGYRIGGFDAYTSSNVPKGSGLSSSAVFENMIGTILHHCYNDGEIDPVEIAKISQFAEREFFGKPCGLMDQLACVLGGVVAIDFTSPEAPSMEQVALDLSAYGYGLCIVNTGGNHADLTEDYASVPAEMKAAAAYFGHSVLREGSEEELMSALPALRTAVGDRAVLRALHFFRENRRVAQQLASLRAGDLQGFLEEVSASGRSSFCYLQNVYTHKNLKEQGISLALCLCDTLLARTDGAWRVHGGGFAGTVQAYVPIKDMAEFCSRMEEVFGEGACTVLRIRPQGAQKLCFEN